MVASKVKFSHETAEAAAQRENYNPGWVYATVAEAKCQESKEKPEKPGVQYKMLVLNWKPLRDPSDVSSGVGRGINDYACLPFWDESWDGLDAEVQNSKTGKMEPIQAALKRAVNFFMKQASDRFSALFPDEVPGTPRKNENGELVYNGEVIGGDEYDAKKIEAFNLAGNKAEELWNNDGEGIAERACWIRIAYEPGSKYPSVVDYSATEPTGNQLIDYRTKEQIPVLGEAEIMGVQETSGETEETEAPAPAIAKGTNGKAGKPTASKATVAAASKVAKKGAPSRARR